STPGQDTTKGKSAELPHLSAKSIVAAQYDQTSSQNLESIRKTRTQQMASNDFPIGPGDVLQVSVPGMEELRNRQVRVSDGNMIELPILGAINVSGMDERQIRNVL